MVLIWLPVADPGFPVGGGAEPLGGAPTSDVGAFQQKRKNLIMLGGARRRRPPGSANGYQCQDHFRIKVNTETNCMCLDFYHKSGDGPSNENYCRSDCGH